MKLTSVVTNVDWLGRIIPVGGEMEMERYIAHHVKCHKWLLDTD